MKKIDLNTWNRKEHFEFYTSFDEPFWGLVTELDCTKAYKYSKKNNLSFFAYYLHKSLVAINQIEDFRLRIQDNCPVLCDEIHASPTIARKDGTFAIGFVPFNTDFSAFSETLAKEIAKAQSSKGLFLGREPNRIDAIHYSSVPWFKFSGLTHARNFKYPDSSTKITFGKASFEGEKMSFPVAVNSHHALVDGYQASEFLKLFQELLNQDIHT
jgi:chloramphenicol O-acetyltransferase type A